MNYPSYSGPVNLISQSDLMPNFAASSPVSAASPIASILDADGNLAVFSIGTDGELWIVRRDPVSPTGWSQFDFTHGLGGNVCVNAFDVAQAESGEFAIAVALAPANDGGNSPVYLTAWLSNTPDETDWENFANNWIPRPANCLTNPQDSTQGTTPVTDGDVSELHMGAAEDTSIPPLVVVFTQSASCYLINGDDADTTWSWAVMSLPTDATDVQDLAFGYFNKGGGVFGLYLLYTLNGVSELIFSTLPVPLGTDTSPVAFHLTPPVGAVCLASLRDPKTGFTNLFVGGAGVTFYNYKKQTIKNDPGVSIVVAGDRPAINDLILAQDQTSVSLWALAGGDRANDGTYTNQILYYTSGPQPNGGEGDWNVPMALQNHVNQVCAARSPDRQVNELVTALSNDTLACQWQDSATTLWRSTAIPLQDLSGEPIEPFSSYTTHLHFSDDNQTPLPGLNASLTASQWTWATINGFLYQLGPDSPVSVKTDSMGNLTIITRTKTISTPIYQVNAADADLGCVNPADNAIAGLSKIKGGSDLKSVQLPDNSSLLPAGTPDDTADFAALCIANLTAAISQLPADGSAATDPGPPGSVPPDQVWGGTMDGNSLSACSNSEVALEVLPSSLRAAMTGETYDAVGFVEGVAGDVLRCVETGIAEVEALVCSIVQGVVRIAFKIAGEWVYIILRAIGDVLEAINWVISMIGIAIEKVVEWLGFIFCWDDILTTQAVLNNMALQTLRMVEASVGNIKTTIDNAVEGITGDLPTLPDHPSLELTFDKVVAQAQPRTENAQAANDFFTNSAGGNFINYQILHGGALSAPSAGRGSGDSSWTDLVQNSLVPLLQDIDAEFAELIDTLVKGIQDGTLTIPQVVGLITKTLAETAVEVLAALVDVLATVAEAILKELENILFSPVDIPLLSGLYKWATKGESMTLAGGLALLAAIPSTIAYKLIAGEAPFANGTGGLDTDSWDQIFELPGGAGNPNGIVLSVGASHGEYADYFETYTRVGGLVDVGCGVIGEALTLLDMASEDSVQCFAYLGLAVTAIDLAVTVPVDKNRGQRALGSLVWGITAAGGLIQGLIYLIPTPKDAKGNPVKEPLIPESGPLKGARLAPINEVVVGGYSVVACVIELIDAVLSVDLEMLKDDRGDRIMDLVKVFENVGSASCTGANGLAAIAGDENPEFEVPFALGACAAQTKAVILGLVRDYDAITDQHLYQPY